MIEFKLKQIQKKLHFIKRFKNHYREYRQRGDGIADASGRRGEASVRQLDQSVTGPRAL